VSRSRVRNDPRVRVPAAADAADEHELSRTEQPGLRALVALGGDSGRSTDPLSREVPHGTVRVRDRRHPREQQPSDTRRAAVAENSLEQLDVDLALPPGPGRSERQHERARPTTPRSLSLDDDQTAAHKPIARLQVPAAAQPGTQRRSRSAGPRALPAAGIARERERGKPIAARKIITREHRRDGIATHRAPPTRDRAPTIARLPASVRGGSSLCSSPVTDPQLRLLPRSPSAVGAAGQGVEAVKGQVPGRCGCPRGRAPGCRSLNPSRSPPRSRQAPRRAR
jgi:hypothetical protein